MDPFHSKISIFDSSLLCNENGHKLKVRKLGFESFFFFFPLSGLGLDIQPLRVPSVRSQGPVYKFFAILSSFSISETLFGLLQFPILLSENIAETT